VYFNLLSLTQTWVTQGKLKWAPSLLLVHGGLTLGALLVISWRDGVFSLTRERSKGMPA
jgi:lipopolysaccharide export system permease protein